MIKSDLKKNYAENNVPCQWEIEIAPRRGNNAAETKGTSGARHHTQLTVGIAFPLPLAMLLLSAVEGGRALSKREPFSF